MKKQKKTLEQLDDMVRYSWKQLRMFHKAIKSFDEPVADEKEKALISGKFLEQLVRAEDAIRETQKVMAKIKKHVRKPLYRALKNSR